MFVIAVEQIYGNFFFLMWVGYCLLPLLDYILPVDHFNLTPERVRKFEKDRRFLVPLYTIVLLDFAFYLSVLIRISRGTLGNTWTEFLVYAVSAAQIGMVNGTVGHELFHRRALIHKVMGTLSFSKMLYGHFFIQHIRSHHKFVATPVDPSTAQKGESLYYFFIKTVPRGVMATWNHEQTRLESVGVTNFLKLVLFNRVFIFHFLQALYMGFVGWYFVYSLIMVFMLETINYLEHYGLERQSLEKGPDG